MRTSKVSRIEALKIYSRRMARWRSNSSPFLSGDLFSDLADFSFNQPKWRREKFNFHRLKNAQVIFCPSMNLTEFLAEYGKYISAKILIAGNDDTEFHTPLSNLPNSIKHVYLQNSFISDNNTAIIRSTKHCDELTTTEELIAVFNDLMGSAYQINIIFL